jgi:hypothetical protein
MTPSKRPSLDKLPLDEDYLHRVGTYSFDSRVINIGQRDGWFTITNSIQSTSDITPYNINFYLDSTYAPFQFASPYLQPNYTLTKLQFPAWFSQWLVSLGGRVTLFQYVQYHRIDRSGHKHCAFLP